MNADEVVKGLHYLSGVLRAQAWHKASERKKEFATTCSEAAALIESLQDQLAEAQRRADAAIKDMECYIGRVAGQGVVTMTYKRIEEIKARCEAATPGPWDIILNGHNIKVERTPANIDFIAHAREDIPWLLDQLAEAQRRADAAVADLDMACASGSVCEACKHFDPNVGDGFPCRESGKWCGGRIWQWRGPQE